MPPDWGPSVVAVGVFDGVHRGHRTIVSRAVDAADALGASPVVVTFDPHPARVLRPDAAPLLLGSIDERVALLSGLGIQAVLVLGFDHDVAAWPAEEFVQRVLVDALHAQRVVVGEDFRFGHRAAGDVELLKRLGRVDGFDVEAVALVGDGEPLSSTLVRRLVAAGDVAGANAALGRPYAVRGPVVRGDARGRQLGYPTANLALPPGLAVPADGVYAGWLVRADGSRFPAAISVGSNPTFSGADRRVEAHALDVDLDLYDEPVAVEFTSRLRGMEKFDSVEELVAKMAQDVDQVRGLVRPDGVAAS